MPLELPPVSSCSLQHQDPGGHQGSGSVAHYPNVPMTIARPQDHYLCGGEFECRGTSLAAGYRNDRSSGLVGAD